MNKTDWQKFKDKTANEPDVYPVNRVYESDGVLANVKALVNFLETHNGLPAGLWIRTMKDARATLETYDWSHPANDCSHGMTDAGHCPNNCRAANTMNKTENKLEALS